MTSSLPRSSPARSHALRGSERRGSRRGGRNPRWDCRPRRGGLVQPQGGKRTKGAAMRVAIGADHAGFELKERLKQELTAQGHEVLDQGTHGPAPVDYPDYAAAVARAVRDGRADRGVVACGSG